MLVIAMELYSENNNHDTTCAASSALKKGLLTVFPGLYKQKDLSRMKRNQYHLRVFQVSQRLVQGCTDSHALTSTISY